MGRLIIIFFGFYQLNVVYGQQQVDIKFNKMTTQQNLSQNYISSICQDYKGYIWFGTYNGLNRFDGKRIENFYHQPDDSTSIPSSDIKVVFRDRNNRLWIGTRNGLCWYNPIINGFEQFPSDHRKRGLTHGEVRAVYVDAQKRTWVGTYGGGIDCFDSSENFINNYSVKINPQIAPLSDVVNCFCADDDKNLWVGTELGGLALLDTNSLTFKTFQNNELLSKTVINCIEQDSTEKNILWVGTWNNGLLKFNKITQEITQYSVRKGVENTLNNNTVRAISQDNQGNLWLCTFGGGLNCFNKSSGRFIAFVYHPNNPSSLSYNLLWSSYLDKSGQLWLGSFGGGVNKGLISNRQIVYLSTVSTSSNLSDNNAVSAICVDRSNNIWLGTIGGGISIYDAGKKAFKNKTIDLEKNEVVRDIFEDTDGRVWIATENGLYRFNARQNYLARFSENLIDKSIYCIFQDADKDIWLGTFDEGIIKIGYAESLKQNTDLIKLNYIKHDATDTNSLSGNRIWCIFQDRSNDFWIGTNNGLDRFDKNKNGFKHYKPKKEMARTNEQWAINNIYQSNDGSIWLGTNGTGLVQFNKSEGNFTFYNGPKVIYGILEDLHGNLWLSTENEGICKFNAQSKTCKFYGLNEGFQGDVFERRAYGKLSNGFFVFGGTNGANIFHPDSIWENNFTPPVVISDFKLFNESVSHLRTDRRFRSHISELKDIELSYDENIFTIEFTSLDYVSPDKHQFVYKLEGFDKKWNVTGLFNNTATYTNLNDGLYVFKVTDYRNGNFNETEAVTLTIHIHPPFWKSWWFRAALIVMVFGLVYLLIQIRTQSLKNQKKLLEEQVQLKTRELLKQKEELEQSNHELNRQKEEIISQRDYLRDMAQKVEDANQQKINFFTNISHELRTPLTLLIGPVNRLIASGKYENTEIEDLTLIQRNAFRLKKLVNQLMDFRKIETGTMPLSVQKGDIVDFVKSIKESFNKIATQYNIHYYLETDFSSENCWFDSDKIEKIIYNLLSNAFKYTPSGGTIKIVIRKHNQISAQSALGEFLAKRQLKLAGHAVEVAISDTGRGIKMENLDKIFNRFYQIENVKSSLQESTGIGLAMTKDMVELHKGIILVNSQPGKGSTFTVIFPVSEQFYIENNLGEYLIDESIINGPSLEVIAEDYEVNKSKSNVTQSANSSQKQVILIVDDHADLRKFLRSSIADKFQVIEAENGAQGIQLAITHQPALIISDVMMPVIDGIELCRTIKLNIETSHIPVLLLTARAQHDQIVQGLETGADDYITKPFDSQILKLKVNNIIETRNQLVNSFASSTEVKISDIAKTSVDTDFVVQVTRLIQENMTNPAFHVDNLAREIGMGRTLFYQKIKKLTNQSVNDFIITVKLKFAIELMRNSDKRISEICYDTGFSNPRYFASLFKKQFHMTPTEYIQQFRNEG